MRKGERAYWYCWKGPASTQTKKCLPNRLPAVETPTSMKLMLYVYIETKGKYDSKTRLDVQQRTLLHIYTRYRIRTPAKFKVVGVKEKRSH